MGSRLSQDEVYYCRPPFPCCNANTEWCIAATYRSCCNKGCRLCCRDRRAENVHVDLQPHSSFLLALVRSCSKSNVWFSAIEALALTTFFSESQPNLARRQAAREPAVPAWVRQLLSLTDVTMVWMRTAGRPRNSAQHNAEQRLEVLCILAFTRVLPLYSMRMCDHRCVFIQTLLISAGDG